MPTCSRKWSWHHHQSATAVLKTRRPNIYCRDARFCRQQEQTCGQRQAGYTPNSTSARRNWKRWPPSSCKQDSQCSGDREEKKDKIKNKTKKQQLKNNNNKTAATTTNIRTCSYSCFKLHFVIHVSSCLGSMFWLGSLKCVDMDHQTESIWIVELLVTVSSRQRWEKGKKINSVHSELNLRQYLHPRELISATYFEH